MSQYFCPLIRSSRAREQRANERFLPLSRERSFRWFHEALVFETSLRPLPPLMFVGFSHRFLPLASNAGISRSNWEPPSSRWFSACRSRQARVGGRADRRRRKGRHLSSCKLERCPFLACAVKRRRFPVGASPTRQPLQPEATGAVMEVTKWLKPLVSVSRYPVTARGGGPKP